MAVGVKPGELDKGFGNSRSRSLEAPDAQQVESWGGEGEVA